MKTPTNIGGNNLATWLPTATEIRMADLYTITLKNAVGSGPNLIPDPNGIGLTWSVDPVIPFSPTGGAVAGGKWVYTGTGAASSFHVPVSLTVPVTPGATYTFSCYIDASNVTSGVPFAGVHKPDLSVGYAFAAQNPGANSRVVTTFTVPSGVIQAVVILDTDNCTVANGQPLTFSNPQLELGSVASPYAPLNVLRYTSWDSTLVVSGNTFFTGPPNIERTAIEEKLGMEISTIDVTITASLTDLLNGVPILQAIGMGLFEGAAFKIERLFMDSAGNQIGTVIRFAGFIGAVDELTRSSAKIQVEAATKLLQMNLPAIILQPGCTNTLFDARCTLNKASFAESLTTQAGSTVNKLISLSAKVDSYYDNGQIVFTSGPNNGLVKAVKQYLGQLFAFNSPLPFAPNAGDTFTAYPGCDKTQATCTTKFNNLVNFEGMPYVPAPETAI